MGKAGERFFAVALGVPAFVLLGHWIGGPLGGAVFLVGLFMGLYNLLAPFFEPRLNYAIMSTGGTPVSILLGVAPILIVLAVACGGWYAGDSGLMAWLAGQAWLPLRIADTGSLALSAVAVGCLLGLLSAALSVFESD